MKYAYIVALMIASMGAALRVTAQSTHAIPDTSWADRAAASQRQISQTGTKHNGQVVTFNREVFQYNPAGHRDPFLSLMTSTELRPTLSDLRLTTIAYDPAGRNSVAILRNIGTKEQYRIRVGSTLGRMRVVRIEPQMITFALEEFGFSRQETLSLSDSTRTRTP